MGRDAARGDGGRARGWSGTTTLAFNAQPAQNLSAMGIAVAPTTAAAGPVLTFPIRSGTLKISGAKKKKVTGKVAQTGGMTLSNPEVGTATLRGELKKHA